MMENMEKILIIDDEIGNLNMLKTRLQHDKFDVLTTDDPFAGLGLAKENHPDIIILDVNMPGMNGFEVCRKLKGNFETSQIPVIMLTCMGDTDYKIEGLEGAGADDYLVKDEIDHREISARIRSILRRTRDSISVNPLSRLPGNRAIEAELNKRYKTGEPFVVGYIDIDNFKAYNDIYGFQNGDKVILACANIFRNEIAQTDDSFLGHIGGDDFIFISNPGTAETIAIKIVEEVATIAPDFYSNDHKKSGGINSFDREGNPAFFPFFAISVALVNGKLVPNPDLLAEIAGKIKKKLKNNGGNRYGGTELI
jgi:diguanylate cyclase (GGDEF)-like protein